MLKKLLVLLLFFLPAFSYAQNFEWGHNGGSIKGNSSVQCVSSDVYGNSYYIGNFQDTISFGNKFCVGKSSSIFILKCSSNGDLIWLKSIFGNKNCFGKGIFADSAGNLLLAGTYIGSVFFNSKDSLNALNSGCFIAKYDTAGNFIWAQKEDVDISAKRICLDKLGNIFIAYKNLTDFGIFKFNNNGKLIWDKKLRGNYSEINDLSLDAMGQIYVVGDFQDSVIADGFKITGIKYYDIFFSKLDSSGKVLWLKKCGGNGIDMGFGIKCFPSGSFYMVGEFNDSANFGGYAIGKPFKGNGYKVKSAFISFFSKDGNIKWVRKADGDSNYTSIACIAFHNEYAYVGGEYYKCSPLFGRTRLFNYGGEEMLIAKMDSNATFLWAFGSGNPNASSLTFNITTDNSGNSFPTGQLAGSVNFGNFKLAKIGSLNAFLVKISDISLWRDKIIKTQYCTGDSILVPYHVSGIIGPGNTFHAELSDSNGSFDSVYYPIGKLNTQGNGIIHCKLPSNLPYSSRYNIHVYSDTPNVTSYYNPQTITIYPSPVVKVAYDSPVCKGSLDTLHASGATSYLWLPSTALSDNKSANPVFKADTNRTYSIIATNGGGCTDTTKFTIKVGPALELAILNPTKDTIVCSGTAIQLRAQAKGGFGPLYFYTWNKGLGNGDTVTIHPTSNGIYRVSTTGGCKATTSVQIKVYAPLEVSAGKDQGICPGHPNHLHASGIGGDSTIYTFTWDTNGTAFHVGATLAVAPAQTKIYKVVLSENLCNLKPDSAFVTVYRTNPMKLFLPADTNVCYGQSISAKASGGDSLRYIYRWDTSGIFISNWVTAIIAPPKTQTYRCILTDSCSLHSDTAYVKVTVSPPLKLKLSNDTIICLGRSVLLGGHGSGGIGDTSKYLYQWDSGGAHVGVGATLAVAQAKKTTKYRCILNDGCSSADTGFVNVSVRPKLSVKANNVSVCKGDSVRIIAQGSGGDSLTYNYTWDTAGYIISNRATTRVAPTITHIFRCILKDNCSVDSAISNATVTVNPNPKSILNISPKELEIRTGEISFTALNTDADSFLWLFGDSTGGKGINQTHSYQTDGTFSPQLVSTNQYGCRDTATGEVIILPQLQVYFPNVFTPDGDSLNETWMPIGIGISRISITIYDRWGGHVFKSESLTKGWNGNILNSNDPAIPGVYPYIVNFWDYNGNKHTKTGTILLLNTARY